jgi:peroxiredoxin
MTKLAYLTFNQLAPDVELQTTDGKTVQLSSLWQGRTLILSFTRHFGCPQCKEMLDELVQHRPELLQKGLSLAIVTQADPEQARIFCEERAPGIQCFADPERRAYAAYGLGRGNIFQTILSPSIWRSNMRLKREKGWNTDLPPAGQDALLMSGTFIIGSDGRIRLPYYYRDITDHPPVDLLLRGLMGMDWDAPLESPLKPE